MYRTIFFKNKPTIIGRSTVAGPKEGRGAIAKYIDVKLEDDMFGQDTFEKAETKILYTAIKNAIDISKLNEDDIDKDSFSIINVSLQKDETLKQIQKRGF